MTRRAVILVVEDNTMNMQLFRDLLVFRGHDVREARSVEESWASLSEAVPDVAIFDIQIPGGGGEALLRRLREAPRTASVPVVAVTAFAMPEDRRRLLQAGFDGYLSKPIDVESFGSAVEAFLNPAGS